ncbi:heme-binding protein [Nocardia sp. CDC160]|uniref:heme-binding protein n=1 Tax=Nocardia sp. CDC160 TaxID=3112166 RepID=UPI002DBBFA7D|nr:heme-binding protein [Nocardia sp. CDC160]MEC3918425.1 heme-binding protein [Nocardia sp. CDC160]
MPSSRLSSRGLRRHPHRHPGHPIGWYEHQPDRAFTAVSWNASALQLAERLEGAPHLADIPGTLFLAGGSPVTAKGGAPIAGIGVAGSRGGDQDEEFAQAGGAAVGS